MVIFSQYTTPMDRDYGRSHTDDNSTNDVGVGVKEIGQSVPMGIAAANVQGIAAKMRSGVSALEIQFPGVVRGTRQAQTPGMYGKEHREALRELAEISEVNLTTHAGFGIMGLAGMDQQGNFSKEQRKVAVDEIKRAIDFAADAARGGSVVVHTGEFQRPISEENWAQDPSAPEGYKFKQYEEEPERAIIRVVDNRTGQIMQQVRKNMDVARPIWLKSEKDYSYVSDRDDSGLGVSAGDTVHVTKGDFIDYENRKVILRERVPEFDTATGRFKVRKETWNDFVREAEIQNKELAWKKGVSVSELTYDEKILPEEAFLRATLQTNEGHSKGWALQYARGFEEERKRLDKLKKAREFYAKLEAATPEDQKWKLAKKMRDSLENVGIHIIPEEKLPTEIIDDQVKAIRRDIEYSRQASTSQQEQALNSLTAQEHVESARKYALKESFRSYSEAGMHAWQKTKQKGLEKRPLMVTMENIFPESYGSHPHELKNLITGARKQMTQRLVKRGLNHAEAEQASKIHIKATLDTGHLNIWRKYWNDNSKKTVEQNDRDFKQWMLKEVEDMAKKGMIGNVHLTDNLGYQDEHLTPGDGTTPNRAIVSILKKHGYKGALTVEPGAAATTDLSDFHGLMKTWRLFGSPVYSAHGPVRMDRPKASWSDIQYSHFGQTRAPYYIFGAYSPSQDWTLWSQVPFE